jgi:hypothetical protein
MLNFFFFLPRKILFNLRAHFSSFLCSFWALFRLFTYRPTLHMIIMKFHLDLGFGREFFLCIPFRGFNFTVSRWLRTKGFMCWMQINLGLSRSRCEQFFYHISAAARQARSASENRSEPCCAEGRKLIKFQSRRGKHIIHEWHCDSCTRREHF